MGFDKLFKISNNNVSYFEESYSDVNCLKASYDYDATVNLLIYDGYIYSWEGGRRLKEIAGK